MKTFLRFFCPLLGLVAQAIDSSGSRIAEPIVASSSNVIYSGLQNIAIPTGFTGVYLNLDNGVTAFAEFSGWDVNPFFGGVGVANGAGFQPARIGSSNQDPIVRLNAGTIVDGSLLYSTGFGGSSAHVGPAANQFQPGQEAYLGFQFTTDNNAGPHFGWMRVAFTANNPGGVILDWAYDTGLTGATPTSIQTGNIIESAPVAGASVVTLNAIAGQSATLGSTISNAGLTRSLLKTGDGTWTLASNQPYTGSTTVNGGTLRLANSSGVALAGTSAVVVHNGGTLLMGADNQINQAVFPGVSLGTAGGAGPAARLDAGGFSQGTGGNPLVPGSGNVGLGALTLVSNSVIDLIGTSVLHFGNSSAQAWSGVLAVWNWSGTSLTGGGAEQILFGTDLSGLNAGQLGQINFYSDSGQTLLSNTALILADGEIIPDVVPVPEPATVFAAAAAVVLIIWRERRRFVRA